MKRRSLPLLALLGLALLAAIGGLWWFGDTYWTAPAAQVPDPESLASQRIEREVAPAEALPQTLQRPLFAQTRRPPPPVEEPVVEAPPEPDPLQDVLLLGVFTVGGERHLMLRAEGKVSRLKEGDTFGPWKVAALSDNAATFQRGKERRQLELKRAAQPEGRAPLPIRRLPAQIGPAAAPEAQRGEDERSSGGEVDEQEPPRQTPPAAAAPRTARTLAERIAIQRGAQ